MVGGVPPGQACPALWILCHLYPGSIPEFGMQTQLMASPRKEAWEHLGVWNGLEGLQQQEDEDGMSELSLRGDQPNCAKANPAPADPSSSRSQLQQVFQLTGHTRGVIPD